MALSYLKTHEPHLQEDLVGQESAFKEVDDFITNFKSQKKKAILAYGSPGCGKSSTAMILAKKHNLELVEVNASDKRNAGSVEDFLGSSIKQSSLFFKGKLILIDEVDGMSGSDDRGGVGAVLEIIEQTTYPIIMTANDVWDNKFSKLRTATKMIKFEEPTEEHIAKALARICAKEGILASPDGIMELAKRARGDFRAAINDLQSLCQTTKKLDLSSLTDLSARDKEESIMDGIAKVFSAKDAKEASEAFINVDMDPDEIFQWMVENTPSVLSNPKELAEAYNALSRADVYKGRIMRKQHWRFLVYKGAMESAGVHIACQSKPGYVQFKQPGRGLLIWRINMKHLKRKEIAQKIADYTHSSKKQVIKSVLPYIKEICKNKTMADQIAQEFEFGKDEMTYFCS